MLVTGVTERASGTRVDFAKVTSRQNVGRARWLLPATYEEIQKSEKG